VLHWLPVCHIQQPRSRAKKLQILTEPIQSKSGKRKKLTAGGPPNLRATTSGGCGTAKAAKRLVIECHAWPSLWHSFVWWAEKLRLGPTLLSGPSDFPRWSKCFSQQTRRASNSSRSAFYFKRVQRRIFETLYDLRVRSYESLQKFRNLVGASGTKLGEGVQRYNVYGGMKIPSR
jgi:hypothetical protein